MATRRNALESALLAVLLLVPAARVLADVAATGTFDIDFALTPPNIPINGAITFDAGARVALGQSVDMSASVGDMTFEGTAFVNIFSESATFTLGAESAGDFEFTASGAGSCDNSGCSGGTGTFAGRLDTITDPGNVLPDGVFTFDGTAATNGGSSGGPGGAFAINAFPLTATPVGGNVKVSSGPQTFYDTVQDKQRNFEASALFANVSGAGDTQFVAFSALPGAFPSGVNLNPIAALFVDVKTTAAVSGGVQLCLSYPDADNNGIVDGTNNLTVPRLRLLYATAIGQPFTDVTAFAGNLQVCGDAPGPGPIVIGALPPGATTTSTTTSTSSTLPPGATTTTSTTAPAGSTTTTSLQSGGSTTTSTTLTPSASTTTTVTVSPGGPTTTSTTLPVCAAALDCLDLAIAGPLCPGETLNPKLSNVILKKLSKAQALLLGARATSVAKKIAKLTGKAQKQLGKVAAKADAFVSKPKGAISADCRDRILTAVGRVTEQIQASRI